MLYLHGICSFFTCSFSWQVCTDPLLLSSFDINFLEKSGFHFPLKELVHFDNEICNVLTGFSYYPNLHEQAYPHKVLIIEGVFLE
jgi:hypothetical protein